MLLMMMCDGVLHARTARKPAHAHTDTRTLTHTHTHTHFAVNQPAAMSCANNVTTTEGFFHTPTHIIFSTVCWRCHRVLSHVTSAALCALCSVRRVRPVPDTLTRLASAVAWMRVCLLWQCALNMRSHSSRANGRFSTLPSV